MGCDTIKSKDSGQERVEANIQNIQSGKIVSLEKPGDIEIFLNYMFSSLPRANMIVLLSEQLNMNVKQDVSVLFEQGKVVRFVDIYIIDLINRLLREGYELNQTLYENFKREHILVRYK